MRRIERPPLVVYLDRDLFGSFVLLWIASILFCLAWVLAGVRTLWILAGFWSLVLFGWGLTLLFRVRAFAVDRGRGEFRAVERSFPGLSSRSQGPLDSLAVWLMKRTTTDPSSRPVERFDVIAAEPGRNGFVVVRNWPLGRARELAEQLAVDMGRPLQHGTWDQ